MMPALTSVRGVAAWWVVAYHFRQYLPVERDSFAFAAIDFGYLGVDLFFILSGFIISTVHAREFKTEGARAFPGFLIKRFARVYPLHVVMLLAFIVIPLALTFLSTTGELTRSYSLESFLLSLLLIHALGILPYVGWNFPSWSIGVEAVAYLLFPLFNIVSDLAKGLAGLSAGLVTITLCLPVIFLSLDLEDMNVIVGVAVVKGCLEFLMGCLLYRMVTSDRRNAVVLTLMLAAALHALRVVGLSQDFVWWPATCAAVIALLTVPGFVLTRILSWAPLVFIGEISYSTYMCHIFVREMFRYAFDNPGRPFSALMAGAYFFIVLGLSVGLYFLIERPARERIRKSGLSILKRRFPATAG